MTLTAIILLVLALYVLQLFLQETSRFGCDIGGIVGSRDHLPAAGVVAARLDRAKCNMQESLPLFLGLALLAPADASADVLTTRGALVFLVARVLYVPAYVSGVPVLRSLMWLAGMAGLVMMAFPHLR